RFDGVERRVVGAAGDARCQAEFLGGRGCGRREPFLETAIEIAAGLAPAARIDAASAMRRQLLVDHARHRLVGRRPVAVAAAEHGAAYFFESILAQVIAQHLYEMP